MNISYFFVIYFKRKKIWEEKIILLKFVTLLLGNRWCTINVYSKKKNTNLNQ